MSVVVFHDAEISQNVILNDFAILLFLLILLAEFIWKIYLETKVFKLLSVVCTLLSLAVVWSEVVFSIPGINLSIFSILLNVQTKVPFLWQWLVVSVPVTYITICACWSLFQFRFFNFYRLVPHQETDANSLLFSAAYLCRLIAPIAYNFLLMIHNDSTAFYDVLGQMNLTPFLGREYNVYFPMILIIFCIANYFNLYSKFILNCCIKRFHRFVFEEKISEKPIAQGKEILKHERELWERGINSSHVNVNTEAQERGGRFPDFKKIFHPKATQDKEGLLSNTRRPYGTSPTDDPYEDFNNGIV